MADWTQIANLALARLGEDPISSIDDDTPAAIDVKAVYELVRDDVLRRHPWNCAQVRVSLAPDAETPAWGYDYQYTVPADPFCLRAWRVDDGGQPVGEFKLELSADASRRVILTDIGTELKLLMIVRVEDPTLFDASLVTAIAAAIAEAIAFRRTGSRRAEAKMEGWAEKTADNARSADGQEGTPEEVEESDFLNSRA